MATQYLPAITETFDSREELIEKYFNIGFKCTEIVSFLCSYHNVEISVRHLKRVLKKQGLCRRVNKTDVLRVYEALKTEMNRAGDSVGHRLLHDRLKKLHNIVTDRETVRLLMLHIDPYAVELRKHHRLARRKYYARGPNFVWHIDGWDKLKPYGLSVHGCIDGFSRRVMWLEANASNKDPYAVGSFYVECIKSIQGLPRIIRGDRGTENGNIAIMQSVLRDSGNDIQSELKTTFLYGKSTSNQRIEAWWSKFKQGGMDAWITHFRNLVDTGILDTSSEIDIQCVRFCYMNLLRVELKEIMMLWNTHHIRKCRESVSPNGKPDILYSFPELYESHNCLQPFNDVDLETVSDILSEPIVDCDPTYKTIFELLMEEGHKVQQQMLDEAAELLAFLLDEIESISSTMT